MAPLDLGLLALVEEGQGEVGIWSAEVGSGGEATGAEGAHAQGAGGWVWVGRWAGRKDRGVGIDEGVEGDMVRQRRLV